MKIAKFKLTQSAEEDLLNIALFGMRRFGIKQSEEYKNQLLQRFQEIAEAPLLYPSVDYIRQGYRRSVCGSHSIYYRIQEDFIEIMRIIGQDSF